MSIGRPLSPLTVSAEQREQLQSWSRRAKTAQALALRSRIVLLAADGLANKEIARRQGCSQPTAGKWRQRFLDFGVDGLLDEPRPGTPRSSAAAFTAPSKNSKRPSATSSSTTIRTQSPSSGTKLQTKS